MRLVIRHAVLMTGHLLGSAIRVGRWWMPVVVPALALAAALLVAVKVTVPTLVYVFF